MSMRVATGAHVQPRMLALMAGIEAAGDRLVCVGDTADVAIAKFWGDANRLKERYRVLICELGYLGDRTQWSALTWDGLAGRGLHGLAPERPEPVLEPWRVDHPGYALVLGQVADDWAVWLGLNGGSYGDWLGATCDLIQGAGYEVRVRKHPEVSAVEPWLSMAPRPTLREELAGARLAVTLNSTAAVYAACMGVPIRVLDEQGSMAAPISGLEWIYEEPPHRREWVNRLARFQWSMRELADGTAWRVMRALL